MGYLSRYSCIVRAENHLTVTLVYWCASSAGILYIYKSNDSLRKRDELTKRPVHAV